MENKSGNVVILCILFVYPEVYIFKMHNNVLVIYLRNFYESANRQENSKAVGKSGLTIK